MIDPLFVACISGGISLVTNIVFYNIRRLRCTHIKTPCCECDRVLMTTEELTADDLKQVIPKI